MKKKLFTLCLITLAFFACEKDDEKDEPIDVPGGKGTILIGSSIPNADGMSGSAYMQLVEDLSSQELTNDNAIPYPFSSSLIPNGNDIFVTPGLAGDNNYMYKYSLENNHLVKKAEMLMDAQAGGNNLVFKGDKAYLSTTLSAKIEVINHFEMTRTKSISISSYGVGDNNPDPTAMVVRDNLLYVALLQTIGRTADPDRPMADVLIIDTQTDEVVKMITDSISSMSTPSNNFNRSSIFMDENKDIYLICSSGLGALPGHVGGILRIKNGETEFDKAYRFSFNDTPFEGESNMANGIMQCYYAGNGKLYGAMHVMAHYSNPPNYLEDRVLVFAEVDIYNKTLKKLNIPSSNMFGGYIGPYNNKLVFGTAATNDNGFFVYDPVTGQVSQHADVTVVGYPWNYIEIK